ncbi:MAG: methyltransferase domain-containing protein [Candidatus Atribacteria bacterium]|nr:methyltransferase domain-containing protein [Candidatus Atribacteria bacterium]
MKEEPEERVLFSNGKNGGKKTKSLGPVVDLEEHVPPDWWKRIFNSLYLKTDGDIVDDQNITKQEVDYFTTILHLSPGDRILDLCCGQGRHSLELARRGFTRVKGLDRSHYLIQKARAQARREGLSVQFKEGDARKLPYPTDSFDTVLILGNSFGYFESTQDDLKVLTEVFRVLKPGGKIFIDVADGEYLRENFQPHSWEWISKKEFVLRERSLSKDRQRLISREIITHIENGVIADQFYAERLYSSAELMSLLEKSGFSGITIHGEHVPSSQRNQDLGMMERRILLSGEAKKEWTHPQRAKGATLKVTVLLGDPNQPDPLKPQTVFDEDDIYTVNQLKAALGELKGYQFTYLDQHRTLLHDLLRMRRKIDLVFNLCDEGFNNDARQELHVPALLDILGIPYTGSGPQCLAYCYDKSLVRGIAKELNIPVPRAFLIKPEDFTFKLPFSFPVLIKPNFGDSSFGITQKSVATNLDDFVEAVSEIRNKFGYDKPILVEEFLPGKDLSLGVIGNPPESYQVLPISEEDYSALPPGLPPICGYEAKWLPDSPYSKVRSLPVELPEETEKTIIESSLKLFERLECQDYARFDWRLDSEGQPRLLEVNPNPGWCWDGHLAKMSHFAGIPYPKMLEAILKAAICRLNIVASGDKL